MLVVIQSNWICVNKKIEISKDVSLLQNIKKSKKFENEVKIIYAKWMKWYIGKEFEINI